jgi:hypothetical protein
MGRVLSERAGKFNAAVPGEACEIKELGPKRNVSGLARKRPRKKVEPHVALARRRARLA